MRILSNGMVEIQRKNKQGKVLETKQISPQELPNYGISYTDYVTQAEAFERMIPQPESVSTGIEPIDTATQSATIDTKPTEKEAIQPLDLLKDEPSDDEIELQKELEEKAKTAGALIDLIEKYEKGEINEETYRLTRNALASKVSESAFGEGGKNLTEMEQSLLQGSRPTIEIKKQSWLDKPFGRQPPQTGEVLDSTEDLKAKMVIMKKWAEGEDLETLVDEVSKIKGGASNKMTKGGLVENLKTDAGDIINSILGLPAAMNEQTMQGIQQASEQGKLYTPKLYDPFTVALDIGKGLVGELNEATGRPLEGGDIVGRATQRAYEKPATTLLDLLLLTQGARTLKNPGGTSKVATTKATETLTKSADEQASALKQKGTDLRSSARNIRVRPSVYGAGTEAQINATLDKYGFTGPATNQYAKLEPTIASIGKQIDDVLAANPQKVKLADVKAAFMKNLQTEIRTSSLTKPIAQKEIVGYLDDLLKESGKKTFTHGGQITTQELFSLKKKVNKDYGRIANKIEKGIPLTDREKIVYAGRKTLDDIITSKHKDVKELTMDQSRLYDAAPSLEASRRSGGVYVGPLGRQGGGTAQRLKDVGGRVLQGDPLLKILFPNLPI